MSNNFFHFKEFYLKQEVSALKVGTDAVILGAIATVPQGCNAILDIGTGTGILALMLAQRSNAKIIGIEVDEKTALEANFNFINCKWNQRMSCFNSSIQEFSENYQEKFDYIISNPPYFNSSLQSKSSKMNIAKHTATLSYAELVECTLKLLNPTGSFQVILPANEQENFIKIAESQGLCLNEIINVRSREDKIVIRVVLLFMKVKQALISKELVIYKDDKKNYTQKFIELTKDYYLEK